MFRHATMNRAFALIWNSKLGAFVPAPERKRASGRRQCLLATVAIAPLALSGAAHAIDPATLPSGGQVVAGQAAITQSSSTATITQNSAKAIIDWQGFSIGKQASVEFVQPSAGAIALNRVVGQSPSQILGALKANGQVFLINPNGVLFARGAQVSAAGILASTRDIANDDFLAGTHRFSGSGAGTVLNEGELTAQQGGYVVLIGAQVINDGNVSAAQGDVRMTAADEVSLQLDGNRLLSFSVDRGTVDGLVANKGLIEAGGGRIFLTAEAADALSKAVVNNEGVIEAQTVDNRAGKIVLLGDMAVGDTFVSGTLDASAPTTGDGGFIETSAARVHVSDGTKITTSAPNGKTGNWLIDPTDYNIAASGGDMTGANITATLNSSDITLSAVAGSINVNDVISWSTNTLTLDASESINVNAVMTASGTANLTLAAGNGELNMAFGPNNTFAGKVDFSATGSLIVNGNEYVVINSLGSDPNDMTLGTLQGAQANQNTYYALGSDIDASATAGWDAGGGFAQFTPIAISGSVFDGLGHTISGLALNRIQSNLAFISAAAFTNDVRVRNVGMIGGTVDGGQYAAGLIGINYGTVSNAFSTMSVIGFQNVGGLVGENRAGVVRNSYAGGPVSGTAYVGGLVGYNSGEIRSTYATGAVTGSTAGTGGLVGRAYFGSIDTSFASGAVSGNQWAGGLVGISQTGAITDTYASGAVTGGVSVGGLVGQATNTFITNSYARGAVSGTSLAGGLVGDDQGGSSATAAFWDAQTSGQSASALGVGMTTAAMTTQLNYTNSTVANGNTAAAWDFVSVPIWRMGAYPCLAAFSSCIATTPVTYTLGLLVPSQTFVYSGGAVDPSAVLSASFTGATLTGTDYSYVTSQSGSPMVALNAGSYSVTLAMLNPSYSFTSGSTGFTLVILPKALTVAASVASRIYDGTTDATVSSYGLTGLISGESLGASSTAAAFDSANVGVAKTVSISGIALADVVGSGGGLASNYTASTTASATADITVRTLNVEATGSSRTYDGTTATTVTLTDDRIGSDDIVLTDGGATFADRHVGTAKTVSVIGIGMTGAAATNYVLGNTTASTEAEIVARDLTVYASTADRVYDGTTATTTTLADDRVSGDLLTLTSDPVEFADKNAGTKVVTATGIVMGGTDAGDYVLASTTATTIADITPATLFVTGLSASNRVYDGTRDATLSGTAAIAPLGSDDVVLSGTNAGRFLDKFAGIGKAVEVTDYTITGADAGNYVLTAPTSLTADIARRALDIAATGTSKTYDGTTAAVVDYEFDLIEGDAVTATGTAVFADKNAGLGKSVAVSGISIAGTDALNYELTATVASTQANILQKLIDVTVVASDKIYDGTVDGVVALSSADLVAGDVVTLTGTGTFADKNVGVDKTVEVSGIATVGADSANYAVSDVPVSGTADISARVLRLVATSAAKVYDGLRDASVTVSSMDVVEGDDVSFSGTGTFADKNAGVGKAVAVSGIQAGGEGMSNYTVSDAAVSTTADITRRPIALSRSTANKVYDGGLNASVAVTSTQVLPGDVVAFNGTGAFLDRNVGVDKAVRITGIGATGADAGNYSFDTTSSSQANVTAKPVSLSLRGYVLKQQDSSVAATFTPDNFALDGIVSGDAVSVTQTGGSYDNADSGAFKTVSVVVGPSDYAAGAGTELGNYSFFAGLLSADIGLIADPVMTSHGYLAATVSLPNVPSGTGGFAQSALTTTQVSVDNTDSSDDGITTERENKGVMPTDQVQDGLQYRRTFSIAEGGIRLPDDVKEKE